jgi:hypothetical protein
VARLRAGGDEDSVAPIPRLWRSFLEAAAVLNPLRGNPPSQANLLWDVIYVEEITHCAAGLKWFIYLHDGAAHEEVVRSFHQVVCSHFYGSLKVRLGGPRGNSYESEWVCAPKPTQAGDVRVAAILRPALHSRLSLTRIVGCRSQPPFNDEARARAGFEKEWYMPLVDKPLGRRAPPPDVEASRDDGGSHEESTLPAAIEAR